MWLCCTLQAPPPPIPAQHPNMEMYTPPPLPLICSANTCPCTKA